MLRSGMDSMDGLGDSSIPPPNFLFAGLLKVIKNQIQKKALEIVRCLVTELIISLSLYSQLDPCLLQEALI